VTGTTPILGKRQHPKDIVAIMEAHAVPYVATANASYPLDLYQKVSKAMTMDGLRSYMLLTVPPGWDSFQYHHQDRRAGRADRMECAL